MKKAGPKTPSVQSLDRGITILEAVAKSSRPVPIGQLREVLGINRSSVFRLANTLRRRGLLANPDGSSDYVVGPAVWRLFRNHDWNMLAGFCRPQLRELSNLTGETAHLGVREGRQALFIDHHTSRNQVIVVTGRTGQLMPLHSTAHGKALLADCGIAELQAIFGGEPLAVYTPRTISSIDELALACAAVKSHGYSLDEAEHIPEVRCVASPVRDREGMIVAAIGVSAPAPRLSGDRLPAAISYACEAARKITDVLSA